MIKSWNKNVSFFLIITFVNASIQTVKKMKWKKIITISEIQNEKTIYVLVSISNSEELAAVLSTHSFLKSVSCTKYYFNEDFKGVPTFRPCSCDINA